jgi:hypothetical protein
MTQNGGTNTPYNDAVYSNEYLEKCKHKMNVQYSLRRQLLIKDKRYDDDDNNEKSLNEKRERLKTLDKTKCIFDAVFESFKKKKEILLEEMYSRKINTRNPEKTFSFIYLETKYIPYELKQNKDNQYDLGCIIYISDQDLAEFQLEIFQHLLGFNICNNYDYSKFNKSLRYFFRVKESEDKEKPFVRLI